MVAFKDTIVDDMTRSIVLMLEERDGFLDRHKPGDIESRPFTVDGPIANAKTHAFVFLSSTFGCRVEMDMDPGSFDRHGILYGPAESTVHVINAYEMFSVFLDVFVMESMWNRNASEIADDIKVILGQINDKVGSLYSFEGEQSDTIDLALHELSFTSF